MKKRSFLTSILIIVVLFTVGCSNTSNESLENPVNGKTEKIEDTLGIKLTTTKITPTGLTLVFNQLGGNPTGDLQTGSMYWLEVQIDNQWISVETLPSEYDVAWTAEAYIIRMNDITEWEVNWEWLYGELPYGNYRIGKEIMDFRGGGDYDIFTYYAYFEIVN